MSLSNTESVATAAIKDAHRVVAGEVAGDVTIVNLALGQGAQKKLATSHPTEGEDVGEKRTQSF
jgi:hypothetical protein